MTMAKSLAREIWVVGAKRTAFGTFGGALRDLTATDLAVEASKAALGQSGVAAEDIDHVIFGNVQQTSADTIYHARHVGLRAGIPVAVPALTVNRLCGSGFQAVVNMGVAMALLPTKGLTLPFVSYGGSSLLMMMASMGVLLSISATAEAKAAGAGGGSRLSRSMELEGAPT
jgi:hypothetical protein